MEVVIKEAIDAAVKIVAMVLIARFTNKVFNHFTSK